MDNLSTSQTQIKLEEIAQWHPLLASKYFEEPAACTMLRYGGSPYNLTIDCTNNIYAKCGKVETILSILFDEDKYECTRLWNSLEHPRIIEFAAIGIALLLFPNIVEGKVTAVCKRGDKLDFYINGNQFMLEVAGRTLPGDISFLHKAKIRQGRRNPYGKNFFVFVCSFSENIFLPQNDKVTDMKSLDAFLEENISIQEMIQLKSNLILEAEWLKASGDLDTSRKKYAQAAEKEYYIYQILREHRYYRDALISLFSCASCWLEAEYYAAADAVISKISRHRLSVKQKDLVQKLRKITQKQLRVSLAPEELWNNKKRKAIV